MSNEKRYWLLGGGARNDVRQSTFASNSVKQSPRFALAAPQAQLQFSTYVSKSSLRNVGRRANELLNFTFAKRERAGENGAVESNARTRRAVIKRTVSSYSKEQYLLANCQFAVRFYTHPKDAAVDAPIDWQAVEFVRISACSDEMPHCPICLDTPLTSARITRCGHVYCYVCLLRYLTVSSESDRDGDKANCPICAEVIRERDLRIAQLRLVPTYHVGDRLRFALVRRSGESAMRLQRVASVRLDVELEEASGNRDVKQDDSDSELFSKLIHVSTKQLEAVVADECKLIGSERQMAADSLKLHSSAFGASQATTAECEDLENQLIFLDLALGRVNERLAALHRELEHEANQLTFCLTDAVQSPKVLTTEHQHDVAHKRYSDAFDELPAARNSEPQPETVLESSEPSSDAPLTPVGTNAPVGPVMISVTGVSCVYQADDGQPIFLHPLNVRCLLAQFGDVPTSNEQLAETGTTLDERFPPFIEGTIVQLDSFEMTIELRKRYKHLAHLPILSHFTIAELDLSSEPNLLDERVVRQFGAQIEKRRVARERRAQEDRLRAQEAEQMAIERERERRAVFDSSNFPSLRTEEEELGEVNESELHNEDTFPQIGIRKSSEGDSVTGASPTSPMPTANLMPNPCLVQSASNSVWFRNAEKSTSDSTMANERQTFSSLVKSIREDESKRQQATSVNTANKTNKAKKPEPAQAAVWTRLKAPPHQTCCNDVDRARMRSDNSEDADYELDGASSLSHFKDAFQQDVDAALLRAFSTMSTSAATNTTNAKPEQLDVHVASVANDACHMQKDDEPAYMDETDRDRPNTKRKKKAEKKTKGTLLFSTNMRRPL